MNRDVLQVLMNADVCCIKPHSLTPLQMVMNADVSVITLNSLNVTPLQKADVTVYINCILSLTKIYVCNFVEVRLA